MFSIPDNPRGSAVIQISIAAGVIDTVAVFLRILSRRRSFGGLGIDDWFIIGSLFPLYGMIVSASIVIIQGGLGKPMESLTESELVLAFKGILGTMVTYGATITIVRVSILLTYYRLFPKRRFQLFTKVMGGICLAWFAVEVLLSVFRCHPVSVAWDPRSNPMVSDRCLSFRWTYIGFGISNTIIEHMVLAMPLFMIWRLKFPIKQKLMLSAVFMIGILACIGGLMRILTIGNPDKAVTVHSFTTPYTWSQVETALAILCACLSTYRPLFASLDLSKLSGVFSSLLRKTNSRNDSPAFSHSKESNADTLEIDKELEYTHNVYGRAPSKMQILDLKAMSSNVHVMEVNPITTPSRSTSSSKTYKPPPAKQAPYGADMV